MAGVLRSQFQSFAPLELSWSLARADDDISAADAPGAACGFANTQQCLSDLDDDVDYAGEGAGIEAAVSRVEAGNLTSLDKANRDALTKIKSQSISRTMATVLSNNASLNPRC